MCLLAEEVFSSREEYRLIMNYIYYCIYYCIYYSQVHLWRLLAEDTLKSGLTLDPSCPATEALVMQVVNTVVNIVTIVTVNIVNIGNIGKRAVDKALFYACMQCTLCVHIV